MSISRFLVATSLHARPAVVMSSCHRHQCPLHRSCSCLHFSFKFLGIAGSQAIRASRHAPFRTLEERHILPCRSMFLSLPRDICLLISEEWWLLMIVARMESDTTNVVYSDQKSSEAFHGFHTGSKPRSIQNGLSRGNCHSSHVGFSTKSTHFWKGLLRGWLVRTRGLRYHTRTQRRFSLGCCP